MVRFLDINKINERFGKYINSKNKNCLKINIYISDDKFVDVKKVTPNICYTRFDEIYDNFEVLKIKYGNQYKFVPISINGNICYISSYMVDIDKKLYYAIFFFVYTRFHVHKFLVQHSSVLFKRCTKGFHYSLMLPETFEEYFAQFTSKTRYNLKRSQKILYSSYRCEIKHLNQTDLDLGFFNKFVLMAGSTKDELHITAETLLKNTSDALVLYSEDKMISAVLYNRLNNSDDVACISMAYDKSYSEYGVGKILYYQFIKNMILQGVKRVFMGGGDYGYKKNSHAEETKTCCGVVSLSRYERFIYKIFGIFLRKKD